MNAIKTIGLSASLVLATGLANATDYNLRDYDLGDITNSYSSDFYAANSFEYFMDPFIDTFTFSITEESRLSASASSWVDFTGSDLDGSVVVFSSIQLEGFVGEVAYYEDYDYYDDGYYGDGYYGDGYYGDGYYGGIGSEAELNDVILAAGSYSLQIEGELLDYMTSFSGSEGYGFYITASSIAAPVPEPSSIALMLGGLGLVGFMAARRKRA